MDTYIIVCLEDFPEGGEAEADTVLATRQVYATRELAETYAKWVAVHRRAVVVRGRFTELRKPVKD